MISARSLWKVATFSYIIIFWFFSEPLVVRSCSQVLLPENFVRLSKTIEFQQLTLTFALQFSSAGYEHGLTGVKSILSCPRNWFHRYSFSVDKKVHWTAKCVVVHVEDS
ncbi:hypothetical protein B0H34DRAFT_370290 [Crassisporium funariophilum]|nr:hypothetical protein B0H34DRAFT_370290 [Crassisporium funariophilum]